MNCHERRGEQVPDGPSPADAASPASPPADADAASPASPPADGDAASPAFPPADADAAGGSSVRRQLSFRASGLTIELEITGSGSHRRLAGRLIPGQQGAVEVKTEGGVITAAADALGRFTAEAVPSGPISLRCRLGAHSDLVTGWIAL